MTTRTSDDGWAFATQASDAWLGGFTALSGVPQTLMQRWLKDCTDQVQSNLDAWTQLSDCKNPEEAFQIQQRWWRETVDRLSADVKDFQDQVAALAQQGPFNQAKSPRPPRVA